MLYLVHLLLFTNLVVMFVIQPTAFVWFNESFTFKFFDKGFKTRFKLQLVLPFSLKILT